MQHITSGKFADEWDAEAAAGYKQLEALKSVHAGEDVRAMGADLMSRLGPGAGK